MNITFYYLSGSPFSWKVWLALEHKRLGYELVVLNRDAGDLDSSDFRAINPQGRAPALVDGPLALSESAAIVEYLEDAFPSKGGRLWPRDKRRRAYGRQLASEAESYLYPPVRRMMEELVLRKEGEPDEALVRASRALAEAAVSGWSERFDQDFLLGSQPTAADFALYPLTAVIMRLSRRRPDLALADILPAPVLAWRTRIEGLAYFDKTYPPHWR